MKKLTCLLSLIAGLATSLLAQNSSPVDRVVFKQDKVFAIQGDQPEAITKNLKFPHDVEISTNGTFTVGKGKERKFEEGQTLFRDGWLLNPDGSFQPVMDHLVKQAGKVMIVRDGRAEPLTQVMTFPNQASISPDGFYTYPGIGRRVRLNDGEWFELDGTPIENKDAATLIHGQVVMQRDGSRILLQTGQKMGMSDGTWVSWDGTVQPPSAPAYQLREGQTVLLAGSNLKR